MFKSLLADHMRSKKQYFLFPHVQLLIGRVELIQQYVVGQRTRGRGHQSTILIGQRLPQLI